MHIWALGVGIVLVGEFMGWNFAVEKGGMYGALVACWVVGLLYTCIVMINSEVTSAIPAAGGQYAQAKHTVGPLMAFNVGLYLTLAYTMLEAANANVLSDLLSTLSGLMGSEQELSPYPFAVLAILALAFLNYRGVFASLTLNFVITGFAFATILVLFVGLRAWSPSGELDLAGLAGDASNALPYGWIGVIAAFQFGMWFYLGIEGTAQAAEECRSAPRSVPLGSLAGIMTLIIAASLTWFVCAGTLPWHYLGTAITPLFDAALRLGSGRPGRAAPAGDAVRHARLGQRVHQRRLAGVVLDGPRPLPAGVVRRGAPEVPHAVPGDRVPRPGGDRLRAAAGAALRADAAVDGDHLLDPLGAAHVQLHGAELHPVPAAVAARARSPGRTRCRCTRRRRSPCWRSSAVVFFATFLGYGAALISILAFYLLASIWFVLRRYKFVRRGAQFTADLPRPAGVLMGMTA